MPSSSREIFDLFLRRRTVLSPLRYPGGKRRLAPYVAAALVENDLRPGLFVEPYAGGASVALELLHFDLVDRVVLGDHQWCSYPLAAAGQVLKLHAEEHLEKAVPSP